MASNNGRSQETFSAATSTWNDVKRQKYVGWAPLTLRLSKGERDLGSTLRAGYESLESAGGMTFWVYILRCADQSYCVGHTDNLDQRVAQHQSGDVGEHTKSRRPVRLLLVYSESFGSRDDAFAAERQIKGWSRDKKKALIDGDWDRLRVLAQRRSASA